MMRRRALLAASMPSGGEITPFKADFYFDYYEDGDFLVRFYYRGADELSLRCYNICMQLLKKYGEDKYGDGRSFRIDDVAQYGLEVSIEGEKCTGIESEMEYLYLLTSGSDFFGEFDYTGIRPNGEMWCEIWM